MHNSYSLTKNKYTQNQLTPYAISNYTTLPVAYFGQHKTITMQKPCQKQQTKNKKLQIPATKTNNSNKITKIKKNFKLYFLSV
jgi:hypothetical protein